MSAPLAVGASFASSAIFIVSANNVGGDLAWGRPVRSAAAACGACPSGSRLFALLGRRNYPYPCAFASGACGAGSECKVERGGRRPFVVQKPNSAGTSPGGEARQIEAASAGVRRPGKADTAGQAFQPDGASEDAIAKRRIVCSSVSSSVSLERLTYARALQNRLSAHREASCGESAARRLHCG
jgi:hypothetical protein